MYENNVIRRSCRSIFSSCVQVVGQGGASPATVHEKKWIGFQLLIRIIKCRTSLETAPVVGEENRQVYDIPAIRIEAASHRAEIKICPGCGTENRGEFPENVERGVRYGIGIKTWATYFGNQHHIPLERTVQVIEDLTGHRISEGSLLKASEELSECVRPSNEVTAELLRHAEILNADETGLRVKGKLNRPHVASADLLTYYNPTCYL